MFQDDSRENLMRELFGLYKDKKEGRSGVDAYLDFQGRKVPFELKTTSKGSVTTVRDFGPDHIAKWRDKHWLIGFYMNGKEYYHYGTPTMMNEWIRSKEAYIAPDFKLAQLSSQRLQLADMFAILGEKSSYTIEDAIKIQKKQYTISDFHNRQDLPDGYSPQRMLEIIKDRNKYLIERGSKYSCK